ncbi:MAG: hypothetical protein HND58_04670 [Planctomycetota bacterium]|nr:MAG: hypothetical protein HND58_04670 [Planctomycetota bacterium]
MGANKDVLWDGIMFRFSRTHHIPNDPESWQELREAFVEGQDPLCLLDHVEADLRWCIEQGDQGKTGRSANGVASSSSRWNGLPEFRADQSEAALRVVDDLRRFIEQHPDSGTGIVWAFGLGAAMETLRLIRYEPDVDCGHRVRRGASSGGTIKGGRHAARNAEIVAACKVRRAQNPDASGTRICRDVGGEFGLKAETVRQIWNRSVPGSHKKVHEMPPTS